MQNLGGLTVQQQLAQLRASSPWRKESRAIALQIIQRLEALKWSQADLARALDVSPQAVSNYISGSFNFTLEMRYKLQAALGMLLGHNFDNRHPDKGQVEVTTLV